MSHSARPRTQDAGPDASQTPYDFPSRASVLSTIDIRVLYITALGVIIALASVLVAKGLVMLIDLITNLMFFGTVSFVHHSLAGLHPSLWVIGVPVVGGVIVGAMAKYGSAAIRGHGIPEAMEMILTNESRIPPRITILKPVSSAIAIGTGGPFGAEGPIIATGGALGSLLGQLLHTTATERKILLAVGAASGMTAIFGTPIAAVVLSIELLLFEFKARSIIPVAIACGTAAGARVLFFPTGPMFQMSGLVPSSGGSLIAYLFIGGASGVLAVLVTKLVYWIEDGFERLPIHWMWWPAMGGVAVGVIGYFAPQTLGVGYDNIGGLLTGSITGLSLLVLTLMKLSSWSLALGSGTSGGTLAPLFTIGGGFGAIMGLAIKTALPGLHMDPRLAALVGMAAMFAGASRALLTSVIFAFEVTLQPIGILPLLGGCTTAYMISCLILKNTIMTEKIARRGISVPSEYIADYLAGIPVSAVGLKPLVTFNSESTVDEAQQFIRAGSGQTSHHGFPIVNSKGELVGVATRAQLLQADPGMRIGEMEFRRPVVIFDDQSLREAADHMVREGVGRLPVISRDTRKLAGIITRSDLLEAHVRRLTEEESTSQYISVGRMLSSSDIRHQGR